jgi:hypothetical protein
MQAGGLSATPCGRCGRIFRNLDTPDLYFPGVGPDGIGAAPWAYMLSARSIMPQVRGAVRLDLEPVGHEVNHFDIVRHLKPRDPGSYPPGRAGPSTRHRAAHAGRCG